MNEKIHRKSFKNHLKKIGSGEHSSRSLTRQESADALKMMLQGKPSPAQIGAFMIAHRIRRPEPQELAGMIDTYLNLGPKIYSSKVNTEPICFGMPFDGRTRTAPIYPLTAIILISLGKSVVLHGAGRMPVKYGLTTEELFTSIGLCLKGLSIKQIQEGFTSHGFALIHQPDHFPLAESLVSYREEIGKRPPLASMELIWTAHQGKHLLISGYVHTPTEDRHIQALKLLNETNIITIKGLEGGVDLSINKPTKATQVNHDLISKINLDPKIYNCHDKDISSIELNEWSIYGLEALSGKGPLIKPLIWNAGVYLWFSGLANDIKEGIKKAEFCVSSGLAQNTLTQLIQWRKKII